MDLRPLSSGLVSSSSAVSAVPCRLVAVELIPDGTNASGVVLYDNASAASGTAIAKLAIPASTTAPQVFALNHAVVCHSGIYASLSGTGGNVIVHYSIGD